MMDIESEDIYHYDFTTASELEIFIARLEELIQEWKLPQKPFEPPLKKNDFKTGKWCYSSEPISFADAEFLLTRYHLQTTSPDQTQQNENLDIENGKNQTHDDIMSMENDFFPITNPPSITSHPLARWYGLRDFLVLVPQRSINVASESRVKILLSSLSIAVSNTNCPVPFFIQAQDPWQCYFLGVCQSKGSKTDFEMVHVKRTPLHCKYLTGLLTLFKSKVGPGTLTKPVGVSVRFTYILKDWVNSVWTQEPPDFDFLGGEVLGVSELGKLPFGSTFDPIKELYLNATWPFLLENSVVDGESYSDLEPMQAPLWTVSVNTVDNPSCLLSEYYSEFVLLNRSKHTMSTLLGSMVDNITSKSSDISSSLSAITESKITALSKAVLKTDKSGRSSRRQSEQVQQAEGPISSDVLMMLLYYLFPDADSERKSPYPDHLGGNLSDEKPHVTIDERLHGMKSAPYDSLTWRLAILMSHVVHSLGGIRSAAHLWYEFTQELRYRWENSSLIPGLEQVFPDPRTCLLNQKLQLLNCCISRRIAREKRAMKPIDDDSDSDVDDEFFDCSSDAEVGEEEPRRRKIKHMPWDKPTGRLARHGELKLLETGEYLYIPITQDPVPKTEDQLEEDAEILLQLGTDAHGSELRARLMSASLLSDMEAFKAANPGCILADFIRWYSPRDWIEEENVDEFGQPKGHLSNRMQIPGNTWLEVWQVAKPVPTKWQRRLFNDTKEAEKVLDFLERQNPSGFIELLLPVMSVCVIHKLLEESATDQLPGVPEVLAKLIKKAERLGRMPKIVGNRYEELLNDISAVETLIVQANSLKHKFLKSLQEEGENASYPDFMNFVKSLLTNAETEVPGGPRSGIGSTIRAYFADAAKAEQMIPDQTSHLTDEKWNVISPFPSPSEKEMILRAVTSKGCQRLHAVLKKNECRLCGAFTNPDIVY